MKWWFLVKIIYIAAGASGPPVIEARGPFPSKAFCEVAKKDAKYVNPGQYMMPGDVNSVNVISDCVRISQDAK